MIATAALNVGRRIARAWPRFVDGPGWLVLGIGFALHWSTTVGTVLRWLAPEAASFLLVHPLLGLAFIVPPIVVPALLLLWTVATGAAVVWWYVTTAHIEVMLGASGYGLERAAQSSRWARTIVDVPPMGGGSPFWYQGTPWAWRLTVAWGLWATTAVVLAAWTAHGVLFAYPTSITVADVAWWLGRVSVWPAATWALVRSSWAWRDELLARGSAL